MSCTVLEAIAIEGGTYIVSAAFTDEEGESAVPVTLSWTLTDTLGNVINSRENVTISPPAAAVDVLLSGDDLDPSDSESTYLIFTIRGTYNGSMGSGLPLVEQCKIPLVGLLP